MLQAVDFKGVLLTSLAVTAAALCTRSLVGLQAVRLQRMLPWLQALAAGLLLGDALLHMLPEAGLHHLSPQGLGGALLLGMLLSLSLEHVLDHRRPQRHVSSLGYMDLFNDAFHHTVDGLVIGSSFAVGQHVGYIVAAAILLHELPREITNAGVLIGAGYTPRQAFIRSLLTTIGVPVGALAGIALSRVPDYMFGSVLAVAAGATLYLVCIDIFPAVQRATARHTSGPLWGGTMIGCGLMWLLRYAIG
ncbi:ZIP family metal transporter [Frateuria aurantia]